MKSFTKPFVRVRKACRKTGAGLVAIKNTKKGFTLIELLVVVAIIGILSAIVLVSLTSSRAKARDARRVSDVIQIQKALEFYFDNHKTYPSTTPASITFTSSLPVCATPAAGTDVAVQLLTCKTLFSQTPIPPKGGGDAKYVYKGVKSAGVECTTAAQGSCVSYAIGIGLERNDYVVLKNDSDQNVGAFYGSSAGSCTVNTAGLDKCYDVKP